MEIRRSYDRLISTMGFPILVRWHLYIESGPRTLTISNTICYCDESNCEVTQEIDCPPGLWIIIGVGTSFIPDPVGPKVSIVSIGGKAGGARPIVRGALVGWFTKYNIYWKSEE